MSRQLQLSVPNGFGSALVGGACPTEATAIAALTSILMITWVTPHPPVICHRICGSMRPAGRRAIRRPSSVASEYSGIG